MSDRGIGLEWAARSLRAVAVIACAGVLAAAIAGWVLSERSKSISVADTSRALASEPATNSDSTVGPRSTRGSPRAIDRPTPAQPANPLSRVANVPESGSGTFDRAQIPDAPNPAALTYTIEVEQNLPISARSFSKVVRHTLSDPRSWAVGDPAVLAPTDDSADLRVVLTSPRTTDRLCAPLQTRGRVSCRNGSNVVINAWRWVHGSKAYRSDIDGYRRYVINHEVGHALGNGHEGCPSAGALAPVMLQQTLGLQGCRSNPWPARADLIDP